MNSNFSQKQLRKALIWSSLLFQIVLATAQTTLISPTTDGGFENSASFAGNGWTTVNASPDAWVAGSAASAASGARGAFISNDNGTTWAYSLNAAITYSHLYKEVTVPAGENKMTLTFKWKVGGEGTGTIDNDNLKVFFGPTANVSPSTTAGVSVNYQLTGANAVSGMYKLNSVLYNTETITFPASPGTYKLVFTWKSNASVLANPPAAIDEVSLVSSATSTVTSTAMGGFWSSPQTWVGGVVPTGDDVVIAPNAIVLADMPITVRDLTIAGQLQSVTSFRMTIARDVLVQNTGVWNAFVAMTVPGNIILGIPVYLGGNLTNNGLANFAAVNGLLIFNGSMQNSRMAQTLGGTGTFIGTGSSGILRTLYTQTTGSVTVATTQNLIVSGVLSQATGSLHTNGKLTLNNTAQVFGQPYNQQVCMIAMTNMGAGYTSQPTVTLSAPASGVTATAVANYDAASGTIRSITVTNPGSGYGIAPTVTITGGGSPIMFAVATATVNNLISGGAVVTGQKGGGPITGGLNHFATQQAVGSIFVSNSATTNIGYTSVPEIGFSLPGGMINYVTNGGSGYTSAPTVTVVGGTKVTGGTDPAGFLVNVAQGKIVSITLPTAAGGTGWTSLPTISITGGGGSGATAEFPAGCLPAATPVLSNGMISDFIITNPGFGYGATPSAMLAGGNPTAAAGLAFCRTHSYGLTLGYYLPATAPERYMEDAFIPPSRKMNNLAVSNYLGAQINGDLELYGTGSQLTFSGGGGVVKMGSTGTNTLSFAYSVYSGTSSALGSVLGSVKLASNGSTTNKTFPFNTPFVVNPGTGSLATGNTITSITATKTLNPSGATNTSAVTTGAYGYKVVTNAGAIFGTNPYVTMNYNGDEGIACTDNAQLFIAQATANTGGTRTIRSAAAAAATFAATGARTTDITGASGGPIVPTNEDYYSWATLTAPNISVATGNWNAPATWSLGRVPDCTDWAIVQTGHTVTVNNAASSSVKQATINPGGTLSVMTGGVLSVGCTGFNNTLNIKGTLDVQGGILNVNGNIDASALSVFNQSGGTINVDGNDAGVVATSVAVGVPLIALRPTTFNSVNWTGGTLTIVDPHAATTTTQALSVLGTSLAGANVTSGHTIQFGNGVSTDAGGSTSGFSLNTWGNFAFLPLGNVLVEGGTGTNRLVTSFYQQWIRGNLTIRNGSEYSVTTTLLTGNLNVNTGGTYTSNGYLYMTDALLGSGGGYTLTPATVAQSITNQGVMRNVAVSPVVQLTGLYVNNNSATGVTFNNPLTVAYLDLASGKVTTTNTNLLTLGYLTAEGTLTGGSPTAYIDGPMVRIFSTRVAGALYDVPSLFPIGKGSTYMPVHLTPTAATAGLQLKAEAFTTNTGTYTTPLWSLAPKRWEVTAIANSNYMTETGIRLSDAGIANGKEIVQSSSAAGVYTPISGASAYSAGALTTVTPMLTAGFTGFLSYGERCGTAVPTAAAAQTQCAGKTVADLTATSALGGTLLWYNAAIGGTALASSTVLATGNYYVGQTISGGCESIRIAVAVTVNAAPTATISGATTFCQGQNVTLSANTGTGLTYQWQNNGANIATATNATYVATAAGAYTVIVTNAATCSATSAATTVTVNAVPTVRFTNSLQSGTGSVVNFTNTSSAGTVLWYFGDALNSTSTQPNPTFWYKANGTFSARLVVTNANGCSDSTAVSIAITGVRTGVNDLVEPLKIKVYPNPFSEIMTFEIENTVVPFSNNDKIMVTNALGQVVYQAVLNPKVQHLDTQTWSEGIYNVVIESNGQRIPVKKVVKVIR